MHVGEVKLSKICCYNNGLVYVLFGAFGIWFGYVCIFNNNNDSSYS